MTSSGRTDDERAVSPVIEVILVVAITVVLAAVVGETTGELVSDVTGSNDQPSRLSHESGDAVSDTDIELVVDTTN